MQQGLRDSHDAYDQMVENIQRADLKHSEIAAWICGQIDNGEKAADIAKKLGRSKAWVSRYTSFGDLPPSIQSRVDQVGMDTALILLKAWKQDVERTEWFLKHHEDITRGSAQSFLGSLSESDEGEEEDFEPQQNSSNAYEPSNLDHDSDDEDFEDYEDAGTSDLTGGGYEASPSSTEDFETGEDENEEETTNPDQYPISKGSVILVCCDYDEASQKVKLTFNDDFTLELETGEEGRIPLERLQAG